MVDTSAPTNAISITLASDSGIQGDGITNDRTVNVSGLELNTAWQYRTNANDAWLDGTGTSFTLTTDKRYLAGDIQVRQIDAAGNIQTVGIGQYSSDIELDTSVPTVNINSVAFSSDSGAVGDLTTNVAAQTITGTLSANLASSDAVYVSLDDGSTWATATVSGTNWSLANQTLLGPNTLRVKVRDVAGNEGPELRRTYKLDTVALAPQLSFQDTGSDPTDGQTNNLTITVTGVEEGASWFYSTNSGTTWSLAQLASATSFTLAPNQTYVPDAIRVKQTDVADNNSAVSMISTQIKTDTSVPAKLNLQLQNDTGDTIFLTSPASDFVTNNGKINLVGTPENFGKWEYSVGDGPWTPGTGTFFTLGNGTYDAKKILVRQVDLAGNQSEANAIVNPNASLSLVVDNHTSATPSGTLIDTGSSSSDKLLTTIEVLASGVAKDDFYCLRYTLTGISTLRYSVAVISLGPEAAIYRFEGVQDGTFASMTLLSNTKASNSSGVKALALPVAGYIFDKTAPTVTADNISVANDNAISNNGEYNTGETVTATFSPVDNTDIASVSFDFSEFGGASAVVGVLSNGLWTASYKLVQGPISGANRNVKVTATDKAGNKSATVTDDTNVSVNNTVLPLVFDLDGDGHLDYTHMLWDMQGNGQYTLTAWAGSKDGVLFVDKYHDGKITDISQFAFGDASQGETDLQGLAARYDTNHDGVLNAQDSDFGSFRIWQDINGDGVQGVNEVNSLSDWGIDSLRLTSDGQAQAVSPGVYEFGRTTATLTAGGKMVVADAAFNYITPTEMVGVQGVADVFTVGATQKLVKISNFELTDQVNLQALMATLGATAQDVKWVQSGSDKVLEVMHGTSVAAAVVFQGLALQPIDTTTLMQHVVF